MLAPHSNLGPLGITPEIDHGGPRARVLMAYEWEAPFDESCLTLCENFLSEFGAAPFEGTGSHGEKRAHGNYDRVRAKLSALLTTGGREEARSVRVRSALRPTSVPEFFPSAFEAAMGVVHGDQKVGSFAIDEEEVSSINEFADRAGPLIFGALGTAYGGCWNFPAEYGAEHYVASVNTMPSGMKWGSNQRYADRLVRWMNNIWRRKLRAREGFFREIYPINFLLQSHLERRFRGAPLEKFMEAEGALQPSRFSEKMFRWDVPDENLDRVRIALEPSGLVLSSEAEPAL